MPGQGPRGTGRQAGAEDRTTAFRNRYRVGERLRGRLLRFEGPGLAWVAIDREPLLARIESSPPPGSELHFQVASLYPEIVLRELGAGTRAGGPPPAVLLQQLGAARGAFEDTARDLLASLRGLALAAARREAFRAGLPADPAATLSFLDLLLATARINAWLGNASLRLLCLPWLAPHARDLELVVRRAAGPGRSKAAPLDEALCSCTLARLGRIKVQALHRPGRTAFRLFLDRPTSIGRVREIVERHLAGILPAGAECLGVDELPPEARAGVLAELLALLASASGGLRIPA